MQASPAEKAYAPLETMASSSELGRADGQELRQENGGALRICAKEVGPKGDWADEQ